MALPTCRLRGGGSFRLPGTARLWYIHDVMIRARLPSLPDRYAAWFTAFVRSFPVPAPGDRRNIGLKEEHTHRVCENARRIAEKLSLGKADEALAGIIALFHDLGRFPQYDRYRTFRDSESVNHAALGASVLAERNVLSDLPKEDQDLIVRAVALHNVFRLPDGLEKRLDMHVRIVRDADKLDIWRIFAGILALPEPERPSAAGLGLPETPGYSAAVLERLRGREMVRLTDLRNLNDFKLLQLAWIYDLNFAPSFRLAAERDIVGGLASTLPPDGGIAGAVDAVRAYLDERQES